VTQELEELAAECGGMHAPKPVSAMDGHGWTTVPARRAGRASAVSAPRPDPCRNSADADSARAAPALVEAVGDVDAVTAEEPPADTAAACGGGRERGTWWGSVPNVYWRTLGWHELRRHARFVALPPVERVQVSSAASFAYVRQSDPLWWELHAGRLTSSCLLATVGGREPGAARRLGLPRSAAARAHAVDAARRLSAPALCFPAAVEREEELNAAAVAAFNAEHTAGAATQAAPPAAQPAAAAAAAAAPRPRRRRKKPLQSLLSAEARLCASAASRGISGVRCAWGSAQEPGTLFALLCAYPDAQLHELGLCALDAGGDDPRLARLGLPPEVLAALPPLGASPDALLAWPPGSQWCPRSPAAEGGYVREVVEVKNACPFRDNASQPSKRRGAAAAHTYVLSDRGPPAAVQPSHVLQLQLEMLCCDTHSALLACESATKGMSLFRLYRDDEHLAQMLTLVAQFCARHARGAATWPSAELFAGDPRHGLFLRRTAALAEQAQMVDFVAQPRRPEESRPFLDV